MDLLVHFRSPSVSRQDRPVLPLQSSDGVNLLALNKETGYIQVQPEAGGR
jgi:hypothetical protein